MPNYRLDVLGSPPITFDEDGFTDAAAINKYGVVAGYTAGEAVIWEDEKIKKLPMPGTRSFATDINEFGTVVGMHHVTYPSRAFVARVNQLVDLTPVLPNESSCANAINSNGLVAGWTGRGNTCQAYLYDSLQGGVTLIDPFPGHAEARAFAVNAAGHVAGISKADGATGRIFFYRDGEVLDAGAADWLTGLNDTDVAVGSFGNYPWHAFRADLSSGTAIFEDLGLTTFPGYHGSHGNAINNSGVVVGHSFSPDWKLPFRAFIHFPAGHPDAGFHDLQSLVDDTDGWVLESARGINDNGVITGNCTRQDRRRSFVLTPSRPRLSFDNPPALQFIKIFGGTGGGGGIGVTPGGKPIPIPPPLLPHISEAERDFQLAIALENFARGLGEHSIATELHDIAVRLQRQALQRQSRPDQQTT